MTKKFFITQEEEGKVTRERERVSISRYIFNDFIIIYL